MQFLILQWKNFKILSANYIKLVFVLLVPVIVLYLYIYFLSYLVRELAVKPECYYDDRGLHSSRSVEFLKGIMYEKQTPCDGKGLNSSLDIYLHLFTSGRWRNVAREMQRFLVAVNNLNARNILNEFEEFYSTISTVQCTINLNSFLNNEVPDFGRDVKVNIMEFFRFVSSYASRGNRMSLSAFIFEDNCDQEAQRRFLENVINTPVCASQTVFEAAAQRAFKLMDYKKFYDEASACFDQNRQRMDTLNQTLTQHARALRSAAEEMTETYAFLNEFLFPYEVKYNFQFSDEEDLALTTICGQKFDRHDSEERGFSADCKHLFSKSDFKLMFHKLHFQPDNAFTRRMAQALNDSMNELKSVIDFYVKAKTAAVRLHRGVTAGEALTNLRRVFYIWREVSDTFVENVFIEFMTNHRKFSAKRFVNQFATCVNLFEKAKSCFEADQVSFEDESQFNRSDMPTTVVFLNDNDNHLKYQIRRINIDKRGDYWGNVDDLRNKYEEGFVFIQDLIDQTYIKLKTGRESDVAAVARQFPSRCSFVDSFFELYKPLSLIVSLPWIYTLSKFMKDIAAEHELNLKNYMKVMGMSGFMYWITWLVTNYALCLIPIIAGSFIIKQGAVFKNANLFVFILYFLFSVLSMLTKGYLVVFFFHKQSYVSLAVMIILGLYFTLGKLIEDAVARGGLIAYLGFNGWIHGFSLILNFVKTTNKITIGDIFVNNRESVSEYTIFYTFMLGLLDTVYNILLLLMLERIVSGEYKFPCKCKLPFSKKSEGGIPTGTKESKSENVNQASNQAFEDNASKTSGSQLSGRSEDIGIMIVDLVKKFPFHKIPAVNHLTVNFYKDQVTAFLGHNGAGKSTTMNIMSGILKSSSGKIFINGLDVDKDIAKIRKDFGYCPQHDILFNKMTVKEHMKFFGKLKGLPVDVIRSETERLMEDLNMSAKMNARAGDLSGGMKRLLSMGLVYLGAPSIIVLDEPTSGVDAYTRRRIWSLLQSHRRGHTTIISTHSMDEADTVSDRVVVVFKGKVVAKGTTLELKKDYGKGYKLIIELKPQGSNVQSSANKLPQTQAITEVVERYVPGSYLDVESAPSQTLFYLLPMDEKSQSLYLDLFKELERRKSDLRIQNFGVSSPGLEEVFIKINESAEMEMTGEEKKDLEEAEAYPSYRKTSMLYGAQMFAMLLKRLNFFRRSFSLFITQIILPLAIFYLFLLGSHTDFSLMDYIYVSDEPEVLIHPWLMVRPSDDTLETFVARNALLNWNPTAIENCFLDNIGISIRCVNNVGLEKYPCKRGDRNYSRIPYPANYISDFQRQCDCTDYTYECGEATGNRPLSVFTGDYILYNLTHFDIPKYLHSTLGDHYNRYGGFEFINKYDEIHSSDMIEVIDLLEIISILSRQIFDARDESAIIEAIENFTSDWGELNIKGINLVRIWHNNYGKLSLTSHLNILNNILLRQTQANAYIMTINKPLAEINVKKKAGVSPMSIILMYVIFGLCLTIIAASFLIYPMDEKRSGFRHLQLSSGVHPVVYLLSNVFWDIAIFIFFLVVSIIGIKLLVSEELLELTDFNRFILACVLYGLAVIPFTYLFSVPFKDTANAFMLMLLFHIYGIIRSGLYAQLKMVGYDIKPYGVQIFPTLAFGMAVFTNIKDTDTQDALYDVDVPTLNPNISQALRSNSDVEEDSKRYMFYLAVQAGAYLVLLMINRHVIVAMHKIYRWRMHEAKQIDSVDDMDDDVQREEERLLNEANNNANINANEINQSTETLITKQLKKTYTVGTISTAINCMCGKRRGTLRAVKGVSFGVSKGECFGLLGVNGAGKSSLFRMITGDDYPTSGDATINNYSITKQKLRAQQSIGYCPQHEAFSTLLTVKEHLNLFTRLRGVPQGSNKQVVQWAIDNFGLHKFINYYPRQLSGGNQRKLAVALSVLGETDLVCLDEPTTGVDPHARGYIWKAVNDVTLAGRSVLFTSHSMEENEALCHRVTIMVAGRLMCIGNLQHIKTKFNKGYSIRMKINPDKELLEENQNKLKSYMQEIMPESVLVDSQHQVLIYQVMMESKSLPKALDSLNRAKAKGIIEDFSLNQTTLEQVFLGFAGEAAEQQFYS